MSEGFVSVGLPAFRNASTIGDTIRALQRQTFERWECFVSCDDGFTETYQVARDAIKGDERFALHANERRLGVPGNWNLVLAQATADLFKLMCADDVLHEDALQRQVDAMREYPSAVLCTGRRNIVNGHGRAILRNRGLKTTTGLIGRAEVIRHILKMGTNPLGEPSFALYRTDALRRVGGFSSSWEYAVDLASYLEVLELGELAPLDLVIGDFRVSSSSWSSSLASQQSRELLRLIDSLVSVSPPRCHRAGLSVARLNVRVMALKRRLVFWLLTQEERFHR